MPGFLLVHLFVDEWFVVAIWICKPEGRDSDGAERDSTTHIAHIVAALEADPTILLIERPCFEAAALVPIIAIGQGACSR